jgi:hypothetical protein
LEKLKVSDESHHRSRVEWRRRKILEAAIEACAAFQVDILLLPEYSVRPETLQFLLEELHKKTQPTEKVEGRTYLGTVVWAGTFRMPPGMTFNGFDSEFKREFSKKLDWSSILTILNHTGRGKCIYSRYKKYPSLASSEIFSPGIQSLEPLFTCGEIISSTSPFIPWIYTTELICSESFIATSPSNLIPIADSHEFLLKKFGYYPTSTSSLDKLREDILHFSCFTAHNAGRLFRRTILLVPAMTKRTEDFILLGQSLFLSTGLTTVFCNAAGERGDGQSCFIGLDDSVNSDEHADIGPYHGVLPGIFRQNDPKCGCLDKNEQAMVIVDIDPIYAAPSKPRQQVYPQSLSLVAHLPIIESHVLKAKQKDDLWTSFRYLWETKSKLPQRNTSHLDQDEVKKIIGSLECLISVTNAEANKEFPSTWLEDRMESFKEHHKSHPQMLPPPVAIDWLWVDTEESNAPEIEVPPYHSFSDAEVWNQ